MKLSEHLAHCKDGAEVTVFDKDLNLIAQSVDVVEIYENNGVTADFWGCNRKSLQALINSGFYPEVSSTAYLMNDAAPILAGNLSEKNTLEWAETIYNSVI